MDIINYSSASNDTVKSLIPRGVIAEKVVAFPDICEARWLIPTGISILTKSENWRPYAISDIGCGMMLCKSKIKVDDFNKTVWDELFYELKHSVKNIGDINEGNHFVDALKSEKNGYLYFLIHCGVVKDIAKLYKYAIANPNEFDKYYSELSELAVEGRWNILSHIRSIFGDVEFIFDRVHNNHDITEDGVIIRRGAVKILPGELTVIPSNFLSDVALVEATSSVTNTFNSLLHGTGRLIKRSDVNRPIEYDYNLVRNQIYIPSEIPNSVLKMDMPDNYRDLQSCFDLVNDLVIKRDTFKIIAYLK